MGLSGGVDSSTAAHLLKTKGHNVVGLTMEIYDPAWAPRAADGHGCYGPGEAEDTAAAAALCGKLAIPHHVVDLRAEYRRHVLEYVRETYLAGQTPNPCVVCNRLLKFGFLIEKARRSGVRFDLFATGHYARVERPAERCCLLRSRDPAKDQSYFLYGLDQTQLGRTLFPLGELNKSQVREMARAAGLPSAERRESQDFVAGGDQGFLFRPSELREGDIVDEGGRVLGRHRGVAHYTVGQRHGLGVAAGHPLYVLRIETAANRLVVGKRERVFSRGLTAGRLNLIAVAELDAPLRVQAKIRLNHQAADATLTPLGADRVRVLFDDPQLAVTPGQAVVCYQDAVVLGGGVIEKAL